MIRFTKGFVMARRTGTRLVSLTLVLSVLLAGVALADTIVAESDDGDLLTNQGPNQTQLDFGEVCSGSTPTEDVALALVRDTTKNDNQIWTNGASVSITSSVTVLDALVGTSISSSAVTNITLPNNWVSDGTTSDERTPTVTLTAGQTEGLFKFELRYTASGTNNNQSNPGTKTDFVKFDVVGEVVDCGGGQAYFDGFHRPIDMDADYVVAKAGQGVALKWNVFEDEDLTVEIPGAAGDHTVSSKKVTCDLAGTGDETPNADDAGTSSLRWDEDEGQYVFVWKTLKNWANTCREFTVSYDDGDLSGDLTVLVHFTR